MDVRGCEVCEFPSSETTSSVVKSQNICGQYHHVIRPRLIYTPCDVSTACTCTCVSTHERTCVRMCVRARLYVCLRMGTYVYVYVYSVCMCG